MLELEMKTCFACRMVTPQYTRDPVIGTELPSAPWQTLDIDFAGTKVTAEREIYVITRNASFSKPYTSHSNNVPRPNPDIYPMGDKQYNETHEDESEENCGEEAQEKGSLEQAGHKGREEQAQELTRQNQVINTETRKPPARTSRNKIPHRFKDYILNI
ncbi:hypothetical protein QE152_g22332 [Popillia japonica]|uniref:Uncharacterized protein n=1 Tax=Popillia japonica TaxID=7064 RepID=A0AAW1KLX5_POPJA